MTFVSRSPAFAMMPLAQRALGGVLLWDNNITEDPSITVRPNGVFEVGHAGKEYDGTDLYCGSYNANESGEISGGWRHVWDFATDKANGTIKCISLTSQHAGNIGCHGLFDKDIYSLINHCYFHNSGNRFTPAVNAYHGIQFSGSDDKGSILYMKKNSDGGLKLLKRFKKQMWYINTDDITRVHLTQTVPAIKSREELPITLTNDYSGVFVYQGKIHELALTSTTSLRHCTYDLNTGAELSSKDISLPFSYKNVYLCNATVYRDGKYYCFPGDTGKSMIIINEQGEQLQIQTIPTDYSEIYPAVIDDFSGDILFYMSYNSSYGGFPMVIRADDSICRLGTPNNLSLNHTIGNNNACLYSQVIKTDNMNSPFLFFSDAGYAANIIPLVNTVYLATINNLQTPITKTSAQTMKITYEIYDE